MGSTHITEVYLAMLSTQPYGTLLITQATAPLQKYAGGWWSLTEKRFVGYPNQMVDILKSLDIEDIPWAFS